jgi:PAS domain S-box-containing protein
MKEFLEKLYSSDFMPHGYCYLWNSGLVWLHVVSDTLIALAYFSIPVTLIYFIRKRRDLPFHWMFVSFGMFILACGATHTMEVWTLWHGNYWLSGAVKAVTAMASVPTAILLVQLIPQALALPSPEAMRLEIAERKRTEQALNEANNELERRVLERTAELRNVNEDLVAEIVQRKRAEEELQRIVDFVLHYIVVLSPDGKWIQANRMAQEYTGLTLDDSVSVDLIGKVIHPDDVQKMRAVGQTGLSGNDLFEIEARLLGKDGIYRWFLFRYNPLVEQGLVKRWYVSATEIESRKQQEERVRQENARLEERTRIAQELHDTLLQSFVGASLQLCTAMDSLPSDSQVKPKLDRILQLMQQGIEEGRNTIQGLRSTDPRTLDLVLALSAVQRELAVQPEVDFRVSVVGRQQPLRPAVRQEIYRIGREALVNAFCHSRAKCVELQLEYAADSDLRMWVRDNGCGIDPQVVDAGREGHWGLAGMRERATKIGGLLRISSSATAGTEVQLSIPNGVAFQLSPADP